MSQSDITAESMNLPKLREIVETLRKGNDENDGEDDVKRLLAQVERGDPDLYKAYMKIREK